MTAFPVLQLGPLTQAQLQWKKLLYQQKLDSIAVWSDTDCAGKPKWLRVIRS